MMRRKGKEKKDKRNSSTHQSVNTVECGKKHPSKAEDKCWELDKDAASHPASWNQPEAPEGVWGLN
jgi:hypothetical protein